MNIRPIRNDDDLTEALARVDALWGAEAGTVEGDELDVLADLIEAYENKHYPIPDLEPVDLIKVHMEEFGRSQKDFATLLGSGPRASEVLNRKRPLTLEMAYKIYKGWRLPADVLIQPYHLKKAK